MKFSNGYWLQKEGVACFSPAQVVYARVEDSRAELCLPTARIESRGSTLGGVTLTMEVSAPYEGVLRVRTVHHKGTANKGPHFPLSPAGNFLRVEETEDTLIFHSGKLRMVMDRQTALFAFFHGENRLTGSSRMGLAYVNTHWQGEFYVKRDDEVWMRQQLDLDVNERIYGLGERFGPLVKNGQTVEIWNEDGGTSSEQSYKNIPFALSSNGYGVFVNHPERVSFEVGSETVGRLDFAVRGEALDYLFIDGPSMKDVLNRYTGITGRPALPPAWSFGLWLSTSFTTDYDEETVTHFVDGMRSRGIPLSVFHFDCFWMRAFAWCNFLWDKTMFPDPQGMLQRLKAKGLRVCVWINPYIGQESELFDEGMRNSYFVKRADGSVWQWDMWQSGMALVDFTHPEAVKWYQSKLKALLDMGVDCFKTDFGERIPTDVVWHDGSDPAKMHNFYTLLYNQCVFELLRREKGEDQAVLFARSATAGGQRFPVHWGGDCWSHFPSMAESLRGGLSLTASGFAFWSHDIGGFESTSTADVYKRWCAFGLLSSHSRLHGSSSYRVPWNYDEEAVEVLRRFTRLKMRLMPYLYQKAVEAHETGIPMMRMMALEFPDDRSCDYLSTQYMLGDSLLVAPIFREDGVAEYYLPQGTWTHLLSGEIREGGRWYRERFDSMSLPLYVRQGTILPIGCTDSRPDGDYLTGTDFRVYCLADGQSASVRVTNPDGATGLLQVTRRGDALEIKSEGLRDYTVTPGKGWNP